MQHRNLVGAAALAACALSSLGMADVIFTVSPGGPSGLDSFVVYRPTAFGPEAFGGGSASGLGPGDVINGFSQRQFAFEFLLCFSVDEDAVGSLAPIGAFPPYNVMQQSGNGQAAGDAFITTEAFDRDGILGRSGAGMNEFNNVMVINQSPWNPGDDFGLMPDALPAFDVAGSGLDDVGGGGTGFAGQDLSLYFTFAGGSPILDGGSGGTLFFDPTADLATGERGDEVLFAKYFELGLSPADDLDAVTVFDFGQIGVFDEGDQILFSLTPDSPSLPFFDATPGDILSVTHGGAVEIFASHELFGLSPLDNVNMLELVPLQGSAAETIAAKIPSPGALVLLALAGITTRRRRSSSTGC